MSGKSYLSEFSECVTEQLKFEEEMFTYISLPLKQLEQKAEKVLNTHFNENLLRQVQKTQELYNKMNDDKLYPDKYTETIQIIKNFDTNDFDKINTELAIIVNDELYDIVSIAVILGNTKVVDHFFNQDKFKFDYKATTYRMAMCYRFDMIEHNIDKIRQYITPDVCIDVFNTRLLVQVYKEKTIDMVSPRFVDMAENQFNYGCLEILLLCGNSASIINDYEILRDLVCLGYKTTADLLIQHEFNINRRDSDGMTALIRAAYDNDLEFAEYLIGHNAQLDIKDSDGMSALAMAIYYGSFKIAQELLEHGADKETQNKTGATPLLTALYNDDIDAIKFLARYKPNMRDVINGFCPIVHAAEVPNFNAVKYLLANGANINSVDGNKMTPMLAAASNAVDDLISYLGHNKADVNVKDKDGNTPLILVAKFRKRASTFDIRKESDQRVLCATSLIHYGAKVDDQNNEKRTALHYAVENGDSQLVELLLKNNADPKLEDSHGDTPVCIAVKSDDIEMAKLLIVNGVVMDKNALANVRSTEMKRVILQDANIKSQCCLLI